MHLFIGTIQNNQALLDKNESHHLCKVLRLNNGDKVWVTDGAGTLAKGTIANAHPKSSLIKLDKTFTDYQKRAYQTHMAVAPTKSNDRLEWFLEKAAEIGLDTYIPFTSFHSERRKLKIERCERVILAAVKQSLKAEIPTVEPLLTFENLLEKYKNFNGQKLIAHCHNIPRVNLKSVLKSNSNILFLIGPEGDFSLEEIEQAEQNGFIAINLGKQRMRTETAALNCVWAADWVNKD